MTNFAWHSVVKTFVSSANKWNASFLEHNWNATGMRLKKPMGKRKILVSAKEFEHPKILVRAEEF